jgi:hypothetical protein
VPVYPGRFHHESHLTIKFEIQEIGKSQAFDGVRSEIGRTQVSVADAEAYGGRLSPPDLKLTAPLPLVFKTYPVT